MVRDYSSQDMSVFYPVQVRTLDSVIYNDFVGRSIISVMKVDVQGFECRALSGMKRLTLGDAISTLAIEIANGWLKAQGCSARNALQQLHSSGFNLDPTWNNTPSCVRTYFGCDVDCRLGELLASQLQVAKFWSSSNKCGGV
jgi:hypothetical protein